MTSIGGNREFWGKEGEDGGADPRGSSGMRQIPRGDEELLADGDFFSCKAFTLSSKPIAFSHKMSKTVDVSLQSRVTEVSDGSVNEASTGVSGGEDLEGVVAKEPWFCEVGGRTRVSMEVACIDSCYWALAALDLWIE
jgi:hypothetical protein